MLAGCMPVLLVMDECWEEAVESVSAKKVRVGRVYASLNRRGEIAMSGAAWEAIGGPWKVALVYDRAGRRIGVKFYEYSDASSYPVKPYGRGGRMRIVRASRLLERFGLSVKETLVFENAAVVESGKVKMLVLELGPRFAVC